MQVFGFEQEPQFTQAPDLEKAPFSPEVVEALTPSLAQPSELTPDITRIKTLIEGNEHGTLATNDGKIILRAVCNELGLATDKLNIRLRAAEHYYEEAFWDDYNNRTGLNLDELTNVEETGLYDKTEVYDDCDLLDTIATLRKSVLHIDVVSDADRLARILLLEEMGEVDLQPYMPAQETQDEDPVD